MRAAARMCGSLSSDSHGKRCFRLLWVQDNENAEEKT